MQVFKQNNVTPQLPYTLQKGNRKIMQLFLTIISLDVRKIYGQITKKKELTKSINFGTN